MLVMTSVIVKNVFLTLHLLSNFLYSTGGAPKHRGARVTFLSPDQSRQAWVC